MSKALSLDLRVRVLAAVAQGLTQRQAGERFGVSAASVSRWRTRAREQGDARPKAFGGDRRTGRIQAHHNTVMAALGQESDPSIQEVRQVLAEQGLVFGFGTRQRFFARDRVAAEASDRRATAASLSGMRCAAACRSGSNGSLRDIWDPGPRQPARSSDPKIFPLKTIR